jgi:type III secretory pathway lipoprotein EscJ
MINKEDRLYYSPVREIARPNLRDQIDVLRKANEMQTTPTAESKEIILKNQKQIAETLRKIDGKMPP